MDPVDSGQGQEKPSEQNLVVSLSSKGRQRKKNSKYTDYDTDYKFGEEGLQEKHTRQSSGGGRAAVSPKTTPRRGRKAKNVTQQTVDGEKEATDKTVQESDEKTSMETPKKTGRAKRTPSKRTPTTKKTPARKTPATDGCLPTAADGAVDAVQQENGTPKPKRKYVKRQPVQNVTPVTESPCGEAQGEPPVVSEEVAEPNGRRRRGAAKAALKYLHILAKEMLSHKSEETSSQPDSNSEVTGTERKSTKGSKVIKGKKRKRACYDSDAPEDEDFVPGVEDQEAEETEDEESAEDSDLDYIRIGGRGPADFHTPKTTYSSAKATNGLTMNSMKVVWEATETTKKFREKHYSSWVFAEWVPSTSAWHHVPQSDLDKYLPKELHSADFKVSREGRSEEETPLQRLSRFEAVSAHPDHWDMLLNAGGPVWAMEWCPTPDGAPAIQYVALACHQGMDDLHYVNKMYTGPGLVQLWDVGQLEYNKRPDSQPSLAYALAQDKGFIWNLKWCPAGGWELPSCGRKAPFLPRLGLLAVATSNGVVTIYSLPHPDALHSNKKLPDSENSSQQLRVYKAKGVVTLKLGAFKSPRCEKSGQVLSMDWLPEKPHNIIAVGFYDGIVGLWDLSTKSSLLRIRESDASLSLLPHRCLLAHDHAVRALAFCPASRHLLVTAGEDRYVKTWDLRRPYTPLTVQKRYLTNEIYWPLNAPGLLMAQECAYAPRGSQGVHYIDHYSRSLFVIPRTGTVWSISFTDWMNSVVTSDSFGEVIFAVLPQINYIPPYIKRTIERRFPVYFTSLVPYGTTEKDNQETGRVEEEGDAAEAQEGGAMEESGAQSDRGNENDHEQEREGGGGGGGSKDESPSLRFETYKEAVKKYYLHHTDYDMRTFAGSENRAVWKRMQATEIKSKLNLDEMTLAALHKVRFNPNMSCHIWVVSGGQTGLVRLNCLRGMITSQVKKMISDNQAQFNALYQPTDQEDTVQTVTDEL